MLLRLLRTHARPYLPWVVGVLVFQLISTIATLSLPSLNARICLLYTSDAADDQSTV